jgi:pyridoxal phosphate enzyme (YggS family)
MAINNQAYKEIIAELVEKQVTLVAVSKTKPVEDILEMYQLGQRDFGENYVQEMVDKAAQLPKDIRWHFIGHLQTNKVKYIAPFVALIHGVDSIKLLREINRHAEKNKRTIECLMQIHIAKEETKFGLDEAELSLLLQQLADVQLDNIHICGLMGMASFTDNMDLVRKEFQELKRMFDKFSSIADSTGILQNFDLRILSMGMSSDYKMAIEEGSNMVRIGSLLFGARIYDE